MDVIFGLLRERKECRKLVAQEMDYLRMSARVSKLQKISDTTNMSKIQAKESILDRIQRK